ncbi:uncharacterized protein SAPINGB_P000608 [Magnusiomyces paraingens]|uniref:Mating factor alpha n=1 Tax=Magnusiomyces paraingens TaxID=2606893 RepID=A0A5E8B0U1_9ASCO|nr:uncharacterized protein SAPINGB_P000608 [Saprochaete ingens]VVT45012.1 unnamed protein product [Saprochaete ingens]
MKLSTFLFPAALATVALAQESATGPLPTELPGANVIDIIELTSEEYPIGVSNGTNYFIYVVNTTSLALDSNDTDSSTESLTKRSPRWIWWKPFPGEPAWKKRSALPNAEALAEAEAEAEANPRWIWWKPFPGEPAWKKRDANPEAEANPRWIWWKPFPGEPAW